MGAIALLGYVYTEGQNASQLRKHMQQLLMTRATTFDGVLMVVVASTKYMHAMRNWFCKPRSMPARDVLVIYA